MRVSPLGRLFAACLAGQLSCGPAAAQADSGDADAAPLQLRPGVESRHERLADDGFTLVPGGTGFARHEQAQVDLRLWATRGRQAFGVGLGAMNLTTLAPAQGGEPARLLSQHVGPALTVAWRVQLGEDATAYADTSTVPGGMPGDDGERRAYLSTRGGIEWKLTESRFGFERGRLSMRLDSGYRMSLRVRNGGVGLMLRGQF